MTRYEFVLRHGVPSAQQRHSVIDTAAVVLPGADVRWTVLMESVVGCTVECDIGDNDPLEVFALIVQVFNSATLWVAGWPPQTQTCSPVFMGGAVPVPYSPVGLSLVSLT